MTTRTIRVRRVSRRHSRRGLGWQATRTQLDWYEDFNEQNVVCPFVGEIELDRSTARLIAEIKVIIPTSQEYVEEEIEDEL